MYQKIKIKKIKFEIRINAYAGKPWVELSYRIINTSMEELVYSSHLYFMQKLILQAALVIL